MAKNNSSRNLEAMHSLRHTVRINLNIGLHFSMWRDITCQKMLVAQEANWHVLAYTSRP